MGFWVHGRDSDSGKPTEPFFSDADSEDAAREQAAAQGIIVESIVLHVDDTVAAKPASVPEPPCDAAEHSTSSWLIVAIFGVMNLLAASQAAFFGKLVVPKAEWYHAIRSSNVITNHTSIDALLLVEYTVRIVGIAFLLISGVGLLRRQRWGRSLSIWWAIGIMSAYLLMWIAGARYPRFELSLPPPLALLVACAYPIVLLIGMNHSRVVAAFPPSRERNAATAASPARSKWRIRFALLHLVAALTVLAVVFAVVGWWIRQPPVQREIFKLNYGNRTVRESALLQLGAIGPKAQEAVPVVIDALPSYHAANALLQIGSVPALIAVLEDENIRQNSHYLERAMSAFAQMGPDKRDAVPALIQILETPGLHSSKGRKVVSALASIGPDAKAAIPAILRFANKQTEEQTPFPVYPGGLRPWEYVSGALKQIGLEHLQGLPEVHSLLFNGLVPPAINDATMRHIAEFTGLRRLGLQPTQVSDAGFEHLKGLTNLQELWFGSDRITDAGLEHLKGLSKLRLLYLSHCRRITNAGLVHIKRLTNLEELHLGSFNYGTQVTDVGLVHLERLTNLQTLSLSNTRITDAGILYLKGLANLRDLYLHETQITDAGLLHLEGLTNLRSLFLGHTRVTDAGLEHLKRLTDLTYLYVRNTPVTDRGVTKLQQALPSCEIHR